MARLRQSDGFDIAEEVLSRLDRDEIYNEFGAMWQFTALRSRQALVADRQTLRLNRRWQSALERARGSLWAGCGPGGRGIALHK